MILAAAGSHIPAHLPYEMDHFKTRQRSLQKNIQSFKTLRGKNHANPIGISNFWDRSLIDIDH